MGNWAPWGERHLAVNSLHSQVAAFIREKKAADVGVLDCRALGLDDNGLLHELRVRRPDVVFFGSMIPAAGGAAQLNRFHAAMKSIKETFPSIVTVGGGLMYTAVPQQIMAENPQLDFAIVGVFGDNEHTLWELLEELKKPSPNFSEIKGLTYRKGDEIVLNPARPLIRNLDELPMPAYDLFPMDRYYGYSVIPNYGLARGPVIFVMSGGWSIREIRAILPPTEPAVARKSRTKWSCCTGNMESKRSLLWTTTSIPIGKKWWIW